jgi:hypothetical protein
VQNRPFVVEQERINFDFPPATPLSAGEPAEQKAL